MSESFADKMWKLHLHVHVSFSWTVDRAPWRLVKEINSHSFTLRKSFRGLGHAVFFKRFNKWPGHLLQDSYGLGLWDLSTLNSPKVRTLVPRLPVVPSLGSPALDSFRSAAWDGGIRRWFLETGVRGRECRRTQAVWGGGWYGDRD